MTEKPQHPDTYFGSYKAPQELTKAYYRKKAVKDQGIEEPSDRAGQLLLFCLKETYGLRGYQTEIHNYLKIVRQTVFQWFKRGIPADRLYADDDNSSVISFEKFVADPTTAFKLPSNVTLWDFERLKDPAGRGRGNNEGSNQTLKDFLVKVVHGNDRFGIENLDNIAGKMKNVASPHLFWKWAYVDGGIPVTYIEDWLKYAVDEGIFYLLADPKYHQAEVFAALVRRKMCSDPSYFEEYYGANATRVKTDA